MGKGGRESRRALDSNGWAACGRGGQVHAGDLAQREAGKNTPALVADQFSGHTVAMSTLTLNLAEAKARLSELTERVTHGDEVVITRHGKPVARIQQVRDKARRVDVAAFRRATARQAEQVSAADFIRELRDGARY